MNNKSGWDFFRVQVKVEVEVQVEHRNLHLAHFNPECKNTTSSSDTSTSPHPFPKVGARNYSTASFVSFCVKHPIRSISEFYFMLCANRVVGPMRDKQALQSES